MIDRQVQDMRLPARVDCRGCEAVCLQQIKISEAQAGFSARLGL